MSDYFWNSNPQNAPPVGGGVFSGGDPYGPPNVRLSPGPNPAVGKPYFHYGTNGIPVAGGNPVPAVPAGWGMVGATPSPTGHIPYSIGAGNPGGPPHAQNWFGPPGAGGATPPWWSAFQTYIQSKFPNFRWPTGVGAFGGGPTGPPVHAPGGDPYGPPNIHIV